MAILSGFKAVAEGEMIALVRLIPFGGEAGLRAAMAAGRRARIVPYQTKRVGVDADNVVVCLGDVPEIDAGLIDRLVDAFATDCGAI